VRRASDNELLDVLAQHLVDAPNPAVRQKRSNELYVGPMVAVEIAVWSTDHGKILHGRIVHLGTFETRYHDL
jgi:predicted RNA-binding protein YlqC (UPF0109 family)